MKRRRFGTANHVLAVISGEAGPEAVVPLAAVEVHLEALFSVKLIDLAETNGEPPVSLKIAAWIDSLRGQGHS